MFKKYDEFVQKINESNAQIKDNVKGLNIVQRISTDDFMKQLKTNSVDTQYIYRLVNYKPSPKKWVRLRRGDDGVLVPENSDFVSSSDIMFKSPFVICPNKYSIIDTWFRKVGDKFQRVRKTNVQGMTDDEIKSHRVCFSALSVSALINDWDFEEDIDLDILLSPNNEEIMGRPLSKYGRNYLGYNFDYVLVYEVVNSEEAIKSIIIENEKTQANYIIK